MPTLPVGVPEDPLRLVSSGNMAGAGLVAVGLGEPPGLVVVALLGQFGPALSLGLLESELGVLGIGNEALLKFSFKILQW